MQSNGRQDFKHNRLINAFHLNEDEQILIHILILLPPLSLSLSLSLSLPISLTLSFTVTYLSYACLAHYLAEPLCLIS